MDKLEPIDDIETFEEVEDDNLIEKPIPKPKKKLSEKQQDNLKQGRQALSTKHNDKKKLFIQEVPTPQVIEPPKPNVRIKTPALKTPAIKIQTPIPVDTSPQSQTEGSVAKRTFKLVRI